MRLTISWLLAVAVSLLTAVTFAQAEEILFSGRRWVVRHGVGGPGPNRWEPANVWVDSKKQLHLKIAYRNGRWSCAEIATKERLGFGTYTFTVTADLEGLDKNVVFGFFNYPTRDVGGDSTREIDIEFARWGRSRNPVANYTVWPVDAALGPVSKSFNYLEGARKTTHSFTWKRQSIQFKSTGLSKWYYRPRNPVPRIATEPMPLYINLWLFRGKPPEVKKEVEVVVSAVRVHTIRE